MGRAREGNAVGEVRVNISAFCQGLVIAFGVLLLLSLAAQTQLSQDNHRHIVRLAQFFYFSAENNLPTAFSSFLLLLSSALLLLLGTLENRDRGYWRLLAAIFAFLAMDEAFEFHESLSSPMRNLLGGGELGVFNYAWVIPGALGVAVLGLVLFRFWWRQERERWPLMLAAVVYLSGVLGMEMLGARYMEQYGTLNHGYRLMAQVEESLEMLGALLLIRILLGMLAKRHGALVFQFALRPAESSDSPSPRPEPTFDQHSRFEVMAVCDRRGQSGRVGVQKGRVADGTRGRNEKVAREEPGRRP